MNQHPTSNDVEKSSKEQFAVRIAEISEENNTDIIESIVLFCNEAVLDVDDIVHLLDTSMRKRIALVAIEKRQVLGVKRGSKLKV